MNRARILKLLAVALLLAFAIIQFIPTAPVTAPIDLAPGQRADHRHLEFEGIANFRDVGGYRTTDNRSVKWGKL